MSDAEIMVISAVSYREVSDASSIITWDVPETSEGLSQMRIL